MMERMQVMRSDEKEDVPRGDDRFLRAFVCM